jgi:hypothetical protein
MVTISRGDVVLDEPYLEEREKALRTILGL